MAISVIGRQEHWPDQINAVGAVRRIYFHTLYVLWNDETLTQFKEWHYFGTSPSDPGKAPTTADPVFTHTYIQLPSDFELLGTEANAYFYEMGLMAGEKRENIGQ